MPRPPDTIELEGDRGVFDRWTTVEVHTSLTGLTEARLTLGDDGTWEQIENAVRPGEEYRIKINGRTLMAGRVDVNEVPCEGGSGVEIVLGLSTKLSDARYASADPTIRIKDSTVKRFLIDLFAQHGYAESDFIFAAATARTILTGTAADKDLIDLGAIPAKTAKVQPPETVLECSTRILSRYGMAIWDSPDGRICVGAPDEDQLPTYRFICSRRPQNANLNNVIGWKRTKDWREVASEVIVFGGTKGSDFAKRPIKDAAADPEVFERLNATGHFFRPVRLPAERAKNKGQAKNQALHELTMRRRKKDAWEIVCDGWSFWDGAQLIPYSFNTTADVSIDAVGAPPSGKYLVWSVGYRLTPSQTGAQTTLSLTGPGTWVLADGSGGATGDEG